VQQVLRPQRSPQVAALVESVWPLLLHSTNRLAQQEQGESNRLSQEQVGRMCPSVLLVFALLLVRFALFSMKNVWFSVGAEWHTCAVLCSARLTDLLHQQPSSNACGSWRGCPRCIV
jgi:hypothetical protein